MSTFDAARAEIVLEHGVLEAEVTPGTGTTWRLAAGPYRVTVIGTVFEVGWIPEAQRIDVSVRRGRVRVEGGTLTHVVELGPGEQLVSEPLSRVESLDPPQTAAPLGERSRPEDVDEPVGPNPAPTIVPGKKPRRRGTKEIGDWRAAAKAGEFARALELAKDRGFGALARTLNADDLKLLADAARLGGDRQQARLALTKLRERFPDTNAAARAAFDLGRLAAAKPKTAARWYRRYLAEEPAGAYARDATGRLMQALQQSGDDTEARALAGEYLRKHPKGPHAKLARSITAAGPKGGPVP